MEVAWRTAFVAAYAADADRALQYFVDGVRDAALLTHALQLVRTYFTIPAADRRNPVADLAIVRLAWAMNHHLHSVGYWQEIITLWPALRTLAQQHHAPQLYAELTKQLAIIHNDRGDSVTTCDLYLDLLNDPHFPQLPFAQQIDVHHQFGTMLVWQGHLGKGKQILQQVLAQIGAHADPPAAPNQTDCYGVRASFQITPLWESKAYTLNQLGNIARCQGKFAQARQLYEQCWATLNQHGEADNLACVAHQSLGRLWTHWRQPAKGVTLLERGIAIRRRRQDEGGVAINLIYLADALLQSDATAAAEEALNQALPVLQQLDNRRDLALCHLVYGQLAWQRGNQATAYGQWHQALDYLQRVQVPLVEQILLVRHLPSLLPTGNGQLLRRAAQQLLKTVRQQQLTPFDLWRLYRYCF